MTGRTRACERRGSRLEIVVASAATDLACVQGLAHGHVAGGGDEEEPGTSLLTPDLMGGEPGRHVR